MHLRAESTTTVLLHIAIDSLHQRGFEESVDVASPVHMRCRHIVMDRLDIDVHQESIFIDVSRISKGRTGLIGCVKLQYRNSILVKYIPLVRAASPPALPESSPSESSGMAATRLPLFEGLCVMRRLLTMV